MPIDRSRIQGFGSADAGDIDGDDSEQGSGLWGAFSSVGDSIGAPLAVRSALDSIALRIGDVVDAASQDMSEMATEIKEFVSSAVGPLGSDDEDEGGEDGKDAAAREAQVPQEQRDEAGNLMTNFCENYPAARVVPTPAELDALWSRCDSLDYIAVAGAVCDTISFGSGDSGWQPRLRALHALSHMCSKGGKGKDVANYVMHNAGDLIKHLASEEPKCAEKATQVIELLTSNKGETATEEVAPASSTSSNNASGGYTDPRMNQRAARKTEEVAPASSTSSNNTSGGYTDPRMNQRAARKERAAASGDAASGESYPAANDGSAIKKTKAPVVDLLDLAAPAAPSAPAGGGAQVLAQTTDLLFCGDPVEPAVSAPSQPTQQQSYQRESSPMCVVQRSTQPQQNAMLPTPAQAPAASLPDLCLLAGGGGTVEPAFDPNGPAIGGSVSGPALGATFAAFPSGGSLGSAPAAGALGGNFGGPCFAALAPPSSGGGYSGLQQSPHLLSQQQPQQQPLGALTGNLSTGGWGSSFGGATAKASGYGANGLPAGARAGPPGGVPAVNKMPGGAGASALPFIPASEAKGTSRHNDPFAFVMNHTGIGDAAT